MQVFTRAGEGKWVLIHIEVQGKADKTFAERMYTYFARIFDKYHRSITAFAILADRSKSFNPTQYSQDFLGTSLVYRFNNYKVLAQNSSELATSNNPFAAVSLVVQLALQKKKLTEEDLFSLKLELAKALLVKSFDKQKIRQLLNFLRYYIRFEQEETIVKFDKALDILTNSRQTMGLEQFLLDRAERKGIEQGLEKGIEQGLEKGENRKSHAVVVNMIRQTAFSDAQIADLAEVPVAFVAQVRGELA